MGLEQGGKELQLVSGHEQDKRGKFLVFTEEKGEAVRQIFILEGPHAGGLWRMMLVLFKMVGRKFEAPGET